MKKIILPFLQLFLFATLVLLSAPLQSVSADTNQQGGSGDTCGRVNVSITEATACVLHTRSASGCFLKSPEPANTPLSNYSVRVSVTSADGRPHTFTWHNNRHFCTDGDGTGSTPAGATSCTCSDNDVTDTQTSSTNTTLTLNQPALFGYSNCGSYQHDFYIDAVDGDASCTFDNGGTRPGASGRCDTGIQCSAAPPPPTPTATRVPTPVPPTPTRTPTPTPTPPRYNIAGTVYLDNNRNGVFDAGESGFANAAISLTGAASASTVTNGSGAYAYNNYLGGSYTVRVTVPAGYVATTAVSQATTLGPTRTINFGIVQQYTLSGNVYVDTNRNGIKDVGETNYPNVTVNLAGAASGSDTTDASGNFSFPNLYAGSYTATISVPAGYIATSNPTQGATLGPNRSLNFGIALLYTIQGNVYVDGNKDGYKNNGESNYGGVPSISADRGTVLTSSGGLYSITNLIPGSVTSSYTSLPTDYYMVYPLNGPPPTFQTVVGAACNVNGANGASCQSGNIINLNIGISNFYPWVQTSCGNVRVDDGVSSKIPQTAINPYFITTNSACTSPGIVYTGDSPYSFGKGQASSRNWVVGGALYPEDFGSTKKLNITTAYDRMIAKVAKSNTTPTNLTTRCNVASCTLPANLPSGVYTNVGDVNMQAYTVSADKQYIFLIQGNLNFRGPFNVPQGSASTAIFSAKGNITVNQNVGVPPTSAQTSLDGIFSTDRSFVIESTGDCTDQRLNVGGAIITNAALNTGGIFQNDRDLCSFDGQYPTVSLNQRLDMLMFASPFISKQQILTSEVAP